jgi:NAD-dependent dihydropyrimidine dehydrogenase PreA subunit
LAAFNFGGGEYEMIFVDQIKCSGCGTCVDECPTGAITLIDDIALVDADSCDGCRVCVDVCPNQALAWIADLVLETGTEPSALAVIQPPTELINVETTKPVPWRRTVFPVIGGALSWAGRELMPRLTPMALDVLEGVLDRRLSRQSRLDRVKPTVIKGECGPERQRRRRRRRRQSHE